MRHAFLTALLLLAQAISWNASPLYLCLDGDGSLCIDQGPDSCCCDQVVCQDRSSEPQSSVVGLARSHCDCTHIQITVAWTAVIVAPQKAWHAAVSSQTALAGNDKAIDGTLPVVLSRSRPSWSLDRVSAPAFLSSVALRC